MIFVSDFAILELVTNVQTMFVGNSTMLGEKKNLIYKVFCLKNSSLCNA